LDTDSQEGSDMGKRIRSYESDAFAVDFDIKRCIHAEECVKGLPAVFDPGRRPWVDPDAAPASELRQVIERCPSGALEYRRKDGDEEGVGPTQNTVRVSPAGPLFVSGRLRLVLPSGETLRESRAALCRCGHSENKPFCDNSHVAEGFNDAGVLIENRMSDGGAHKETVLEIRVTNNGPALLRGPVELRTADGTTTPGGTTALCRCGASGTKPFCDGSHKTRGFEG
jgi:CDGSH-type Zn-finger protein/uncharacterized Fe-S cluster protein YjdI